MLKTLSECNKLRLIRSEKMLDAEHELEELKPDGEEATIRFDTIACLMNEEIVLFQDQKTHDMGAAFHEFAKGQARLADAWRSLLPKLHYLSVP